MFLKFLKFSSSLDYKTEIFDGDLYRVVIFRVKDFLDVSHSHYNSQDEYYKMQKTRDFLRDLQQNLFISYFTDSYFKSLVTIVSKKQLDALSGLYFVVKSYIYLSPQERNK